MNAPQTERQGVSRLMFFFAKTGWLFREQNVHDFGIDAHIEIVENQRATGKLIALQIKSGASYFKEETSDAFVFRTDERHAAYWVGHSMPVVVVLYNPDTDTAFWSQVTREHLEQTGRGWKIDVPKTDMLADPAATLAAMKRITQPEPYVRRLNRLRVDRHWMDLIERDAVVRVEFGDWINKSLPRYEVKIYTDDEEESWPTLYAPGVGIEGMLEHFFPWAEFTVDEDAGDGPEVITSRDPDGLFPVSDNGETQTYVLILSLNDFGRSFITVDDYLADPDAQETIGFTL